MTLLNKNSFEYVNLRLDDLSQRFHDYSVGLKNVYTEFEKYKLSDINERIQNLLEKIKNYELEKEVEEFNIDVRSFPMNVKIKLHIRTNFGECIKTINYSPALEYRIAHVIQGLYVAMLTKLYDEHDKRGGKYLGDEGFGAWLDQNGKTFVDMNSI